MNLPTRCCYVKVQGREAAKITSLKVGQPRVDQKELAAVLAEFKHRYQRTEQEATDVLKKEEADIHAFYGSSPIHQATDTASDSSILFQNPFGQKDKEKQ